MTFSLSSSPNLMIAEPTTYNPIVSRYNQIEEENPCFLSSDFIDDTLKLKIVTKKSGVTLGANYVFNDLSYLTGWMTNSVIASRHPSRVLTTYLNRRQTNCRHFWQGCIDNQVKYIIDLSNDNDDTDDYVPTQVGQSLEFDRGVSITLKKVNHVIEGFSHFSYSVNQQNEGIEVERLHFTLWPDGNIPEMEKFKKLVDYAYDKFKTIQQINKLLVHCKEGKGRTGTFLAALLYRLINEKYSYAHFSSEAIIDLQNQAGSRF